MQLPATGDLFLDRYRVDGVLGKGGFAVVYRATDRASGRDVALKILTPGTGGYSDDTKSRFDREARVLARLSDPHTITMFDRGHAPNGLLYLVFEYIPGVDLSDLLGQVERLDADATVHVLRQILESLREAHSFGLLHRDLKPENVLVYEYMGDPLTVKLLDFGIARPAISQDSRITQTGELVGTPRYMSPEQLLDKELAPASDLYGVGLMAFEMLMGRDSLQGNRWGEQIDRLVSGHVFSIPEIERVGLGLRQVIEKMSARKVEDRFQSAQEVLDALDALGERGLLSPTAQTSALASRPAAPASDVVAETAAAEPAAGVGRWTWAAGGLVVVLLTIAIAVPISTILRHEIEPQPSAIPVIVDPRPAEPARPRPSSELAEVSPDLGSEADSAPALVKDGCGEAPQFVGEGILRDLDLTALTSRALLVHVPKGYDPNRRHPVVIVLHQDSRDGAHILGQSRFGALADKEGFIVLVPEQAGSLFAWQGAGDGRQVKGAVEFAKRHLCLDDAHVFVVGQAMGGQLAERLSCEPWVAAIATNSYRRIAGQQTCEIPKPYLHLAPMKSRRMPLEGGAGCVMHEKMPLADAEAVWRKQNDCSTRTKVVRKHKRSKCVEYDCEGAPFQTCYLDGGAGWGGSPVEEIDVTGCNDVIPKFPATRVIWEFFESTLD